MVTQWWWHTEENNRKKIGGVKRRVGVGVEVYRRKERIRVGCGCGSLRSGELRKRKKKGWDVVWFKEEGRF